MRSLASIALVFAVIMVAIAIATVVYAADGAPGLTLIDAIRPYVAEIVGVLIAAVVGWLVRRISAWTGLEIEARHREALQSALRNGALLGANAGLDYVNHSVPDAVRYFRLSPDRVADLLRPHLPK